MTSTSRRARERRRRWPPLVFVALVESAPLLVQAPVAGVSTRLERRVDLGPAGPHCRARVAVGRLVMPGLVDQQPPYTGGTGLGDRTLHPGSSRRVLGRDQADIGADRGPGEPGPVTDLYGQRQSGQRRDATQTTQPV